MTKTALVNRRSLLKGGLAVGAALAVGGAVTLPLPSIGEGLSALSYGELAVVDAIADTMFPGDPFPLTGPEAGVARAVDRIVGTDLTPLHATGFRLALRTLEWGTLASRGGRFSRLDRATRTEVLQTWAEPGVLPRRIAMDALKALLGMAYFAHPEIQAHMGWRSACRGGLT